MKKILIKIVLFFRKEHIWKYVLEVSAFLVIFCVLLYLAATDVVSNVFGTVVGFILSSMILYVFKIIIGLLEDLMKINFNTEELLSIYHGDPNYRKGITSHGTTAEFAYADVLLNEDYSFQVVDNNEKFFELDEFIQGSYAQIFSAHSNSAKQNFDTIRLDHYDPDTKTFYLSRSTYFNHLVTNRALDFKLFEDVSLRTVFEYGPRISPLEHSKMSNHIGINALVFLSDGRLLIPRRKTSATISKNKITSSIAIMLSFPAEFKNNPREAAITADYLLRDNIFKNLSDRVKLSGDDVKKDQTDITFLGFGQNIYEGGKPQFYFAVTLNNIDTPTYFKKRAEYIAEQKRLGKKEVLDVDKCMYAADYDSFRYRKNKVKFTTYNHRNKSSHAVTGYEMSYLCNLWHYEKYLNSGKASEGKKDSA